VLIKSWMVAALAGAAAAALALASPPTAHAAGGGWQIAQRLHVSSRPGGIPGVSAVTSGWAFEGDQVGRPTAWERHGSTWTQMPFPGQAGEVVTHAAQTSPDDVWAFTRQRALRWNGGAWTVMHSFSLYIGGDVVLGPDDVWVFGEPYVPGSGLNAWHYNGHTWTQVSGGSGLLGGSGLSASDVWAFSASDVAHWNGTSWTRTPVTSLLPAKQLLNGPAVAAICELAPDNVYAIGDGNTQDARGPIDVLHYNGRDWAKVAQAPLGDGGLSAVTPDGHGGLWLALVAGLPGDYQMLHYAGGRLTGASLPAAGDQIVVDTLAAIPGSGDVLAGGFTHSANNPAGNPSAMILEYTP
jgi:hypothetical protein